jgi:hypothetical protein
MMISPISVSSPSGLKYVSIFNGKELFQRFALHGAGHLYRVLLLDAFIHKNLVMVRPCTRYPASFESCSPLHIFLFMCDC